MHDTLSQTLWPTTRQTSSRLLRGMALAAIGVAVLAASAKAQVPFWPVPLTLQTLAVLVIAMSYGMRLGTATVALYLMAGMIGMPVFAGTPEKGIGLAYIVGPTGGYLLGFLISAALMGWLAERGWDRTVLSAGAAMLAGHAVILALGVIWLASLIGLPAAIAAGLTPFIWATIVKTALGAALLPLARVLVSAVQR